MRRPNDWSIMAFALLFLVFGLFLSERGPADSDFSGEEWVGELEPAVSAYPQFVEGGLPLPAPRESQLGVGGDPRVWASMIPKDEVVEYSF
jgi:hypothetical protein